MTKNMPEIHPYIHQCRGGSKIPCRDVMRGDSFSPVLPNFPKKKKSRKNWSINWRTPSSLRIRQCNAIRGGSRIPRRRGRRPSRGRQHMILSKFPKNCMKSRNFWAMGGAHRGATPWIRHWQCKFCYLLFVLFKSRKTRHNGGARYHNHHHHHNVLDPQLEVKCKRKKFWLSGNHVNLLDYPIHAKR